MSARPSELSFACEKAAWASRSPGPEPRRRWCPPRTTGRFRTRGASCSAFWLRRPWKQRCLKRLWRWPPDPKRCCCGLCCRLATGEAAYFDQRHWHSRCNNDRTRSRARCITLLQPCCRVQASVAIDQRHTANRLAFGQICWSAKARVGQMSQQLLFYLLTARHNR
jgi:hypothetical protein